MMSGHKTFGNGDSPRGSQALYHCSGNIRGILIASFHTIAPTAPLRCGGRRRAAQLVPLCAAAAPAVLSSALLALSSHL